MRGVHCGAVCAEAAQSRSDPLTLAWTASSSRKTKMTSIAIYEMKIAETNQLAANQSPTSTWSCVFIFLRRFSFQPRATKLSSPVSRNEFIWFGAPPFRPFPRPALTVAAACWRVMRFEMNDERFFCSLGTHVIDGFQCKYISFSRALAFSSSLRFVRLRNAALALRTPVFHNAI